MNLIERDDQLNLLHTLLQDMSSHIGHGKIVCIRGEAGIGKTSLLSAFRASISQANYRILWGMCDNLNTPRPLSPLHDISLQMSEDFQQLMESSTEQFAIFTSFQKDLLSSIRPTVLIFEDVHWADSATLDFIKFLGKRIQDTSTLLIMTYRDNEVDYKHPLRIVLGDFATTTTNINLQALSLNGIKQLANHQDVNLEEIHQLSQGNPFFVTELLAQFPNTAVPTTIRDAVLARKFSLSLSAQALLETASIIGQRIEQWLLIDIVGAEVTAIDECLASGIMIFQDNTYQFRHELSRQAILSTIPPHHQIRLHRVVLDILQSSNRMQNYTQLTHHADGAQDGEAVINYAKKAAQEAQQTGAYIIASEQYRRILKYSALLSPENHAKILEAYAHQCALIDDIPSAIAAYEEAIDIWQQQQNHRRTGLLLARLASALIPAGQTSKAEKLSLQAIDILEAYDDAADALMFAYNVQSSLRMLNRDMSEAVYWGQKTVAIAKEHDHLEMLARAYNNIGSATFFTDYNQGCEFLLESLQLAQAANLPTHIAIAYVNLGSGSGELYHFLEAEKYLQEGLDFVGERDLDNAYHYMKAWQALTFMYLGKWDEAAEVAWEVLHKNQIAIYSRIMALVAIGRLRVRRGDPNPTDILDEALSLAQQTNHIQRLAPVYAARAEMAWWNGNKQLAAQEAKQVYDLALHFEHPWFVGELAYWQWRCDSLEKIPTNVTDLFETLIVGDVETASELWRNRHCPYEQAMALSNSHDESNLLQALAIFIDLGAQPAIAMVQQKLRDIGYDNIPRGPRPSTRTNPAGLTNRQLQVLKLLLQQLTNTEIAERLFISPKTVEHHVSTILTKLNVSSRKEAAIFAQENTLFD